VSSPIEKGNAALAERRKWRRVALLALPLLLGALAAFSARQAARYERDLVNEQAIADRLVTYGIGPGETLRLPVEPGTDVLRIVAHAFRRGALDPRPHGLEWSVTFDRSTNGSERIAVVAPGTTRRTRAEEYGMTIGDPVVFNVDVRDHGSGLLLKLDSIADADGVLVRVYRRESIGVDEALHRRVRLEDTRQERLARRTGELDFSDLDSSDRETVVAARWQRVAPIPEDGRRLAPHAVMLAPQDTPETPAVAEIGSFAFKATQRLTATVFGPNTLVVTTPSDGKARLSMSLRSETDAERIVEGIGRMEVEIAPAGKTELELEADRDGQISLAASDPRGVHLYNRVEYDRATPNRPVIVQAGSSPLSLRVQVRRPLSKANTNPAWITLATTIDLRGTQVTTSSLVAQVPPSELDRYDGDPADLVPSERAVTYVLVPAGGRATLRPADGTLDLSVAELDPQVSPEPLASGRGEGTLLEGPQPAQAFIPRRPSNRAEFEPASHGSVRVVNRSWSPEPGGDRRLAVVHLRRPWGQITQKHDTRAFVPATTPLYVDVPSGGPVAMPFTLFSKDPTSVLVLVDGGRPIRRAAGTATAMTVSRFVPVEGETRAALVLGDDLSPGTHTLSFRTKGGAAWVHVPWVQGPSLPAETGWISGDFQP
jgi:hypothetical protein